MNCIFWGQLSLHCHHRHGKKPTYCSLLVWPTITHSLHFCNLCPRGCVYSLHIHLYLSISIEQQIQHIALETLIQLRHSLRLGKKKIPSEIPKKCLGLECVHSWVWMTTCLIVHITLYNRSREVQLIRGKSFGCRQGCSISQNVNRDTHNS